MKILLRLFAAIHAVIALLLICGALLVIVIAVHVCWTALDAGLGIDAAQEIIEAIGLIAVAVVAGWGVFIRLNRYAEELEPEAMDQAKDEDKKLE